MVCYPNVLVALFSAFVLCGLIRGLKEGQFRGFMLGAPIFCTGGFYKIMSFCNLRAKWKFNTLVFWQIIRLKSLWAVLMTLWNYDNIVNYVFRIPPKRMRPGAKCGGKFCKMFLASSGSCASYMSWAVRKSKSRRCSPEAISVALCSVLISVLNP